MVDLGGDVESGLNSTLKRGRRQQTVTKACQVFAVLHPVYEDANLPLPKSLVLANMEKKTNPHFGYDDIGLAKNAEDVTHVKVEDVMCYIVFKEQEEILVKISRFLKSIPVRSNEYFYQHV